MTAEMNVEQKPRRRRQSHFRRFWFQGEFGEVGTLIFGGIMSGLIGAIIAAVGHTIFTRGLDVGMVDLIPLAGTFLIIGLILIPVTAFFQFLLHKSAVATFTLVMFIVLILPIAFGIRHGLYTQTITGWASAFAYAVTLFSAGLGLTWGFLRYGRVSNR